MNDFMGAMDGKSNKGVGQSSGGGGGGVGVGVGIGTPDGIGMELTFFPTDDPRA